MARYTVTIHDHERETVETIEADGMLTAFLDEKGGKGFNHAHSPLDQAKLLVCVNEICTEAFKRNPEQKALVQQVMKHIGKKTIFNI